MYFSLHQKARFYSQLQVALHAGLPLEVALAKENLPVRSKGQGVDLAAEAKSGKSLSRVLATLKAFSAWELRLLQVGEQTGAMDTVVGGLADHFTLQDERFRQLKAQLLYPFLLLLAAIVIPPLPAIARGELSVLGYLFKVGLSLAVLFLVYDLLVRVPMNRFASGGFNPVVLASLRIVNDRHLLRRIFEVAWLDIFTLCMACGLDVVHTLRLMEQVLPAGAQRDRHHHVVKAIERHGQSLCRALFDSRVLASPQVRAFMFTSEQTGTLHSDLRVFVLKQREELAREVQHKVKLMTRTLYLLAILVAASGILGGNTNVLSTSQLP